MDYKLKYNEALLKQSSSGAIVIWNHRGLFQETLPMGRVDAKRFLRLLIENGFTAYNEKRGGKLIKVSR